MGTDTQHPITTAKGSAAVSIILAVIGVFLPFLTGLIYAQIFAAIACVLIIWLYWGDFRKMGTSELRLGHLVAPLSSVLIILVVALLATIASGKKPEDEPSDVSPQDVSSLVSNAVESIAPPPPKAEPIPTVRPTYQIVIEEPQSSPPERSLPANQPRNIEDDKELIERIARQSNRFSVGHKAWQTCIDKQLTLTTGLFGLDVAGKKIQDNYAYSRDGHKLIADLNVWNEKVKAFFIQHEDDLPSFDIVDLANQDEQTKTFLGIGGDVSRAFGRLNAKRRVIQSINETIGKRECELTRKAAVADCVEKDKC